MGGITARPPVMLGGRYETGGRDFLRSSDFVVSLVLDSRSSRWPWAHSVVEPGSSVTCAVVLRVWWDDRVSATPEAVRRRLATGAVADGD